MLERGLGVDISARDAGNQTPLDRIATEGNVDVVRLLIERGAGVDLCDKCGALHCTGHEWTHLGLAGSSRPRRKCERKGAGQLDSGAPLNRQ